MAINLLDLPAAVEAYLENSVTVTVAPISPAVPGTMNPNEFGTTSITVRNAAAPSGIRLIDVKHHLTIEPSNRALLEVPAAPVARATSNPNDPPLAPGTLAAAMFLFPVDNVLDIGDTDTINGLRVKALTLGSVTVSDHIHAKVSLDDMFPVKNSSEGERIFSVV
jgi:hypothetical protein